MEKDGLYFTIQNGLVENGLLAIMTDKALKVYVALCKFKSWETGNCWPSNALLREATGLCKDSVIKGSQECERLGLIKSWRNRREGERFYKKFYHINDMGDVSPIAMDQYKRPMALAKYPFKKDEKGRFTKGESNEVIPSESNGNGLTESNGNGQELKVLNHTHGTKENTSLKDANFSKHENAAGSGDGIAAVEPMDLLGASTETGTEDENALWQQAEALAAKLDIEGFIPDVFLGSLRDWHVPAEDALRCLEYMRTHNIDGDWRRVASDFLKENAEIRPSSADSAP